MARRPVGGSVARHGEDFSFVCPLVKYLLFFFNMIFWVSQVTAGEPGGECLCSTGREWDLGCVNIFTSVYCCQRNK